MKKWVKYDLGVWRKIPTMERHINLDAEKNDGVLHISTFKRKWINGQNAILNKSKGGTPLHQKSNLQCNFVELNWNSFTNDITVSIFHLHPSIQRGGLGKRKYFLRYNEINGWGNLIFHSLQSQVPNLYWWTRGVIGQCLIIHCDPFPYFFNSNFSIGLGT